METTYSLINNDVDEPVQNTNDVFNIINSCTHPENSIDTINFFCNNCGMSVEPGFASLSCSSGLAQGFFCHSYVNSINERFNRFPTKKISTVRSKSVKNKELDKEEKPLSELIEIQRKELVDKFQNDSIPFIEKASKIERNKTGKTTKDVDVIKSIVSDCFSYDRVSFTNILNGYAIYNTGKIKLGEPCPLSNIKPDVRSSLIDNWDMFIKKIEFLYKEYNDLIQKLNPLNKRNRSKSHIELYVLLLVYHIIQFHLEDKVTEGNQCKEINVCTLNDCFDLNRITVTKIRPSNPKSKVKTVICGLADRLGVGNSSLPRLIIESINFTIRFIKTNSFIEYQNIKYC